MQRRGVFVQKRSLITAVNLFCLLCLLATLLALPSAHASPPAPAAFAPFITGFNIPTGIATDLSGNIFVRSAAPSPFDPQRVYRFDPNGALTGQTPIGNNALVTAAMATDSATGQIWSLGSAGGLALIDPNTLQAQQQFNLNQLQIDTSDVYDIQLANNLGQLATLPSRRNIAPAPRQNFGGLIIPQNIQYGDIALLRRGNQIDLFASGLSIVTSFVLRVRFIDNNVASAKVLVSSTGRTQPTEPSGVAVNSRGVVLTSLPLADAGKDVSLASARAIAFSADFPQAGTMPPTGLFDNLPGFPSPIDLASRGMASDAAGNFYVATSDISSTLCNISPGALIIIGDDLTTRALCAPVGGILTRSQDVAVSPDRGSVYMTIPQSGAVYKLLVDPKAIDGFKAFLPFIAR